MKKPFDCMELRECRNFLQGYKPGKTDMDEILVRFLFTKEARGNELEKKFAIADRHCFFIQ